MLSLSNILIKLALVHILVLLTYVYYILVKDVGSIVVKRYKSLFQIIRNRKAILEIKMFKLDQYTHKEKEASITDVIMNFIGLNIFIMLIAYVLIFAYGYVIVLIFNI